jgi:hypothetical protein
MLLLARLVASSPLGEKTLGEQGRLLLGLSFRRLFRFIQDWCHEFLTRAGANDNFLFHDAGFLDRSFCSDRERRQSFLI